MWLLTQVVFYTYKTLGNEVKKKKKKQKTFPSIAKSPKYIPPFQIRYFGSFSCYD